MSYCRNGQCAFDALQIGSITVDPVRHIVNELPNRLDSEFLILRKRLQVKNMLL